jgi:Calcineurin-like phosphoesterase
MKPLFVVVLSFLSIAGRSQLLNVCDGPYVFYNHDQVIVHSIKADSSVLVDSFTLAEKGHHLISVFFSNHPDWNFNLNLRDTIQNEVAEWKTGDNIFAISDIEGEFDNFRSLLIAARIMDSNYRWTFGKGHLVVCGDLFDRGLDVAPELWLLYKLEDEAKTDGGYVHVILGNHDIMNLSGDFRYVQQKYFDNSLKMNLDYKSLYGKDTELGRWLRSKNILERVGNNLCMHGGLSPEVLALKMSLADVNKTSRPYYDRAESNQVFRDTLLNALLGENGLFWYRGYFLAPRIAQSAVESTLSLYGCDHIIVGHTIAKSNIASYYKGKIFGIDVNEHEGHTEGVLIEDGRFFIINKNGVKGEVPAGPTKIVVE